MPDPTVDDPERPYTEARVHEALAQDPRVGELGIEVRIDGETVSLAGAVPTEERREAIEAVVHEMLPDLRVENGVIVEDPQPAGEPEVIA